VGDAEPADSVLVVVPDDWTSGMVSIRIDGMKSGRHRAAGVAEVPVTLHEQTEGMVTLSLLPCGDWCIAGTTQCDGDSVVTCVADGDGCTMWSAPQVCSTAPYCSLGECRATCVDECAAGESKCDGPNGVRTCGQADSDSCLEWRITDPCDAGDTCSAGQCAPVCVDECTMNDTQCSGTGVVTCGDANADGCSEWSPASACPGGLTCSNGTCSSPCVDECTTSGCHGGEVAACGQYDFDSCTDWSPGVSCASADPCREGTCSSGTCSSAPKVCDEPPPTVCADSSTLRTYANAGTCTAGGDCNYTFSDIACANGCASGACAGTFTPTGATISMNATASNGYGCGLRPDGSLACWGSETVDHELAPATTFTSISAGTAHTCGMRTNGAIACWGDNSSGECMPPSGMFTSVNAGLSFTCGVKADQTLACWGYNVSGQATPPAGTFVSVDTGWLEACGVRTTGALACWGENENGSTVPPSGTFRSVSCGVRTCCGVRTNDTIACWGDNDEGQATPPNGAFSSVDVGYKHACAIRTTGTVSCWGSNWGGVFSVPAGQFASIASTHHETCGIRVDGTAVCWGDHDAFDSLPSGVFAH
jgi:hypothetical protein